MKPVTRGILIAACVITLFYLALRLGGGFSDDPRLDPNPPVSAAPQE